MCVFSNFAYRLNKTSNLTVLSEQQGGVLRLYIRLGIKHVQNCSAAKNGVNYSRFKLISRFVYCRKILKAFYDYFLIYKKSLHLYFSARGQTITIGIKYNDDHFRSVVTE